MNYSPANDKKKAAALTIDLEDFRSHRMGMSFGRQIRHFPEEVAFQTWSVLDCLEELHASATFFVEGAIASMIPQSLWKRIKERHEIGCHSWHHIPVRNLDPRTFREHIRRAKSTLEDCTNSEVLGFRAPYFSVDPSLEWFGEILAESGFTYDSSYRLSSRLRQPNHEQFVAGSYESVAEVPFCSIGVGEKRLTIIGGTYLRILPLALIQRLLHYAESLEFIPMIYLHPYDFDGDAWPINRSSKRSSISSTTAGTDYIREVGRSSTVGKLQALAKVYNFISISELLPQFISTQVLRLDAQPSIHLQ